MNCGEFEHRLSKWLAEEIDEQVAAALEAHLEQCSHCQALLESQNHDDASLRTALEEPVAVARVAQRALARLAKEDLAAPPKAANLAWATWLLPLIALAAGFLLAAMILPRENRVQPAPLVPQPSIAEAHQERPAIVPVAHLVSATGPVERFDEERKDWVPIDIGKYYACPTDSRLRTVNDVCELQTSDGAVIRLNDKTEVTLVGTSTIELQRGQVWCKSPGESTLEVRVSPTPEAKQSAQAMSTMWCVGPSCVMTNIGDAGRVQVVTSEGEVNLQTPAGKQKLGPGQIAEIRNGEVTHPNRRVDPLLETRWMQPLIVKQGPDNAELQERVDRMLAQIGRSKVATMYEQEIRSLGEHGVLPLVRFVKSPLSKDDPVKRSTAMTLTADLAPVWLIPDLIDLLEDSEPGIRQQSAHTLHRLTGMNMDLSPPDWRNEPDERQRTALQYWRSWWATHQHQFPRHRVQITKE